MNGNGDHARGTEDDFTQAGNLFRPLSTEEKDRLTSNIAGAMSTVPAEIQARQIARFNKPDPRCGAQVASKLQPRES